MKPVLFDLRNIGFEQNPITGRLEKCYVNSDDRPAGTWNENYKRMVEEFKKTGIPTIKIQGMETRVVNVRKENYDVYIGRASGERGKWGNPFTHVADKKTKAEFVVATREEAIEKYREWIMTQPKLLACLAELKGQRLGCWCKPKNCHGDVLKELADKL